MRSCCPWTFALIWIGIAGLLCPELIQAQQPHGGSGNSGNSSAYGDEHGGSSTQSSIPEPYGGQIFCPVTGTKLGLTQPPIPVQTAIGETKPGFWGKMFGEKPKPGAVIYVCCPECVEKVRREPMLYLSELIADKAYFSWTYAQAPAQRPPRARIVGTDSPPQNPVEKEKSDPVPAQRPAAPLAGPPRP